MESRIKFDLHTHTVYSHGKGSIEENAAAAEALGMECLGIADHGPGHTHYGIDMKNLPKMRADIDAASQRHPSLKILLGAEANIINPSGHLDISAEEASLFDYIAAGYHYTVRGEEDARPFSVMIGGALCSLTSSKRNMVYNTDLVISALYANDIKILTHPGAKAPFDIGAIAKACAERGTWMEINCRHGFLNAAGLKIASKYDVKFILGSDAHTPGDVGRTGRALEMAARVGVSPERIVNLRG